MLPNEHMRNGAKFLAGAGLSFGVGLTLPSLLSTTAGAAAGNYAPPPPPPPLPLPQPISRPMSEHHFPRLRVPSLTVGGDSGKGAGVLLLATGAVAVKRNTTAAAIARRSLPAKALARQV